MNDHLDESVPGIGRNISTLRDGLQDEHSPVMSHEPRLVSIEER